MQWLTDSIPTVLQAIRPTLTALYLAILAAVSMYGLYRYWLVWTYYRSRRRVPRPMDRFERSALPRVTIQLPMFNERFVAERAIEAACGVAYPADRLQIQVLDDSTDETVQIAQLCVQRMRSAGHDIEYLHRTNRDGFKAGALEAGMASATGDFIAIFDADFVAPKSILKRTIHYFTDERVGMVQACWEHLNREDSLLTRGQAVFLDGHFLIEHTARNRSGRWMNFNGTAGIWRRQAIETSGGWQHDTLTEDMDLSYRAQIIGWKFVYLPRTKCPAELPPEMNAFKSQQHRWTKGSIQTAIKLLPSIFRSNASLSTKIEAFFHMTNPVVHVLVVMLTLFFFPAYYLNLRPFDDQTVPWWLFSATLFAMATVSASSFYLIAMRERRMGFWRSMTYLPLLMSLGIGISLNNAKAVIEALVGYRTGFVRTPKYNSTMSNRRWRDHLTAVGLGGGYSINLVELLFSVYVIGCMTVLCGSHLAFVITVPFLMMFAAGYAYVGVSSILANPKLN